MKPTYNCRFCLMDDTIFVWDQIINLEKHLFDAHSMIEPELRQEYLELMIKRIQVQHKKESGVRNNKFFRKIAKKKDSNKLEQKLLLRKLKRDVVGILEKEKVDEKVIQKIQDASTINQIKKYLNKNLTSFHLQFKERGINVQPLKQQAKKKNKKYRKKPTPSSVRVIYTPMGNKG